MQLIRCHCLWRSDAIDWLFDVAGCKVWGDQALTRHNQPPHAWGSLCQPSHQPCDQGAIAFAGHRQDREPLAQLAQIFCKVSQETPRIYEALRGNANQRSKDHKEHQNQVVVQPLCLTELAALKQCQGRHSRTLWTMSKALARVWPCLSQIV
jgi:hypothetical protein